MMKRSILCITAALLLIMSAMHISAEDPDDNELAWEPYFSTGDFALSTGIGISGFRYAGISMSLYPGAEFTLAQVNIADVVPLSFGVAGRGVATLYRGYWGNSGLIVTAGGFGTVHLGFRDFELPIKELQNIDVYIGIGLAYDIIRPDWNVLYSRIRFASYQGINYFVNDNIAVFVESTFMGRYSHYGTIGLLFKTGQLN